MQFIFRYKSYVKNHGECVCVCVGGGGCPVSALNNFSFFFRYIFWLKRSRCGYNCIPPIEYSVLY